MEGKNNTALYEVQNVSQSSVTTQTKTGLGVMFDPLNISLALEDKTVTDARASSTAIGTRLTSTQKIEIGVGNKTELRGTEVEAPQIAFVKTDPNKTGELILGGSTNTTQTSHTEKTETLGLYQENKGQGSTTETLNQTKLKGNVNFDNALKITVQIPDTKGGQALKSQINALVAQGNGVGLDYLNALASNPNVKWDQIALAHEKWSYDQAGLTGAGAALLTVVVAYFTAGMGTTAVGGVAATTTTAATVMGSTALATAVNAGFSALASQTAVAMVNNKGDIGKTLEQLGKEESIKGLLLTMVTAGALDKLNANYFKGVDATSKFGTQLLKNVTNNLASDMMNSALTGKPFDEASLQKSLAGALTTTGMAQGAFAIGDGLDNKTLNAFTHKLAHAVLGCAGGAAIAGNSSGCAPGAVGAVVGELTAEYAKNNKMSDSDALALAKVLAATSGLITSGGGDNAAAVNIAATAGANAAENNFLKHAQAQAMQKEFDSCKAKPGGCSYEAATAIVAKYLVLSNKNIEEVQNCITRGDALCVTNATKDAAFSSEVAVVGVGGVAQVFENRADMVRDGTVVTGAHSTLGDVQLAKRMAGVRQQVCGGLSANACDTKITQLKGEEQKKALMLFGAALTGTPLLKALIEAAPALAAAAKVSVEACVTSPVLCANQAGMAVSDLLAGDAMGVVV